MDFEEILLQAKFFQVASALWTLHKLCQLNFAILQFFDQLTNLVSIFTKQGLFTKLAFG